MKEHPPYSGVNNTDRDYDKVINHSLINVLSEEKENKLNTSNVLEHPTYNSI
jgi:hypothetical protein